MTSDDNAEGGLLLAMSADTADNIMRTSNPIGLHSSNGRKLHMAQIIDADDEILYIYIYENFRISSR